MENRNISIQLIRITAMFMIIFDHIILYINIPAKSIVQQLLNSGVFIFLLISGFLFGRRQIVDWKSWFKKRIIKICIPLWIFMIVTFVTEYFMWHEMSVAKIIVFIFNLQGVFGATRTSITLWFLTLIMICYLITPAIQWIKYNVSFSIKRILVVCMILLQIILAYATDSGMVAGHTISWCVLAVGMYVAGYFIGDRIIKEISWKMLALITVVVMVLSMIVIIANKKIDGTILYDRIIIFYGMMTVDIWLCLIITKISAKFEKQWLKRIINHIDDVSYEIYLVHNFVIFVLSYRLIERFTVVGYVLGTIVISYIMAMVVKFISELISKPILKKTGEQT